jgi:beta-glucosidase
MTKDGESRFYHDYTINRVGSVTMSVVLARKGGLWGEYFNNAFLHGDPASSRVDNRLAFDWSDDLVTKQASDFTSIHWYGKLKIPDTLDMSTASEDFTFIINGDDGFRFYFEEELVIDRWDYCCDEMMVTLFLNKDSFYDIRFEFKEM